MSYIPLARKYRPEKFDQLTGQEPVIRALTNAIRLGREPRTIVFSGVRGIGKTTTARLYAKALCCERGPTDQPCNVCKSCDAIRGGVHEDVLEIDGASNTSVDDVRALQETLSYAPQRSKFRVFIIDEVHMLSQSAFNALLKTLEEPPDHVAFIFATTELNKIPTTILSRCQTFHLERMAVETIRQRIVEILTSESIKFDEEAVGIVAVQGKGSMRDALTFLDQVIALGDGVVSLDQIKGLVATFDTNIVLKLIEALLERDHELLIQFVNDWDQGGMVFSILIEEVAKFVRHCFVIKGAGSQALGSALMGLSQTDIQQLSELSKRSENRGFHSLFKVLVDCLKELSGSTLDRFIVENHLLEWMLSSGEKGSVANREPVNEVKLTGELASRQSGANGPMEEQSSVAGDKKPKKGLLAGYRDSIGKAVDPAVLAPAVPKVDGQGGKKLFWPETWNEMICRWKSIRPMQARILEEVYSNKYSSQEIEFGVDTSTGVAFKLLNEDVQHKVAREMKNLFGFTGKLRFVPFEKSKQPLRESVFEERKRVEKENAAALDSQIREHAVTVETISTFNGTVEGVELHKN